MKKIYLIATIIAIVAGFATYFFAVEIKKNSYIADVEKADVVVAVIDISENTILTKEMLTVVSYPVTSITAGTVVKAEDVIGLMTLQPIMAGEQLIASKVALVGTPSETVTTPTGTSRQLSYQLAEGEYAYSISVDALQGVSGFLKEGDYIDIYYSDPVATAGKTALLLESIKILKVSTYSSNLAKDNQGVEITAYSELVLSLTREQIIRLSDAGSIKIALVPYPVGEKIATDVPEDITEHEIETNVGSIVTVPTTVAAAE